MRETCRAASQFVPRVSEHVTGNFGICRRSDISLPELSPLYQAACGRNCDCHHRMPQDRRKSGKQPNLDQAKELGTMQLVNTKGPRGQVARTHPQSQEKGSAAVIMKTQVAQLARASAPPDAEIFFDELLSCIPSAASREIPGLSSFFPVIVLVPRSTKLLGVFGKAVDRLKRTSAENIFAFGDVTVNFSAMEVLCKGEPVVLTTKEFKTLKYLIQNTPRVISRDELLNEVWGYENYPCTRTVDNHILTLRKKLEHHPSRPVHVRTIHGVGYKFLP